MKRIENLRRELFVSIADFLEKYGVEELYVSDIDNDSPIISEDYFNSDNTFTLDKISCKNGEITILASSAWNSVVFSLKDIDIERLDDILDWLEKNENEIKEYYTEE